MKTRFHEYLARYRKLRGYTQSEIVERLEISRSTYTDYETGHRSPDYDSPFIAANTGGYYAEVRDLLAGMFSSSLKDNPALGKAILTGIRRLAKEDIFSGLNNMVVCTACHLKAWSSPDLTCPLHNASINVYQLLVKVGKT